MDAEATSQNLIKHTLGRPENIEQIRLLLRDDPYLCRAALATEICELLGFFDPRGQRQLATCQKALRDLEAEGHFKLPAPSFQQATKPSPRRLPEAVPEPLDVPANAGEVLGLDLVLVETVDQIRIWNEMMIREHPQGAGPLVGRQLRYLIMSEHGWLGGLGFASAALTLADRDKWIGWNEQTRQCHLERVVCMSRFLIRPSVHCRNLASQVLGMVQRRFRRDFESRYAIEPYLLESFVDTEAFTGTCYQAANWVKVGRTQGRGRQDRQGFCEQSVKDIYVFVLRPDFRLLIGAEVPRELPPLQPIEGLEGDGWAQQEFGNAQLGDRRLGERLVHSVRVMAKQPGAAFSEVEKGNWASIKGYYRMIDHPDDSDVTMEAILAPHQQRTIQRMKAHKVVLCIQDGSDLNFSGLDDCEGLGVIGTNQTGVSSEGLHLHSMLAVTADGLPLGVLDAQCQAREPRPKTDTRQPYAIPIEERKTFSWILALRKCIDLAPQLPDTSLVCVMDREADFFELFDEQRRKRRVDLLVRAKHDRTLPDGEKFFDAVRQSELRAQFEIPVPRQSARPKKAGQKARTQQPQRVAVVDLHYQQIQFKPSARERGREPITLWVVHVLETAPPEGAKPLEWFLLTTGEIRSPEDAMERLSWYALRWRIEDWHRVLKTGCQVEGLAHKTAERLKRAVAIDLVIAWRIMLMTLMGRECPGLPADLLFSDVELRLLHAFARQRKLEGPGTLGVAVRLVARLGGYIARTNDPPPGHQVIWRGLSYLQTLCHGFELTREIFEKSD